MIRGISSVVAIILGLFCQSMAAQQEKQLSSSATPQAEMQDSNLVVARVAGTPITEEDVLSAINELAGQKQLSLDQLKQRNSLLFEEAVNNIITIAVLKNQARLQKVTVDTAKIDAQIQQLSKRFPSREEFLKAIAGQGITEAELRKSIEESLSMQEVINLAAGGGAGATAEEINKFYTDNPDKFSISEQVRASHILLRVDPKSTPEQKAATKKRLEGILSDIQNRKCTFAEAAIEHSQDPSNASKGGDLGLFSRGQMVAQFEDAAFSTKPGEISPVVETPFGYHLIQVTERRPPRKASLQEAEPSIREFLNQRSKLKATQEYVRDLKAKTVIESFMTREEFVKRHPVN